jgi:glycosyltransferase involved in cell wall biosynthesis
VRIALHVPSLAGGGAERCAVDLVQASSKFVLIVERFDGPLAALVEPERVVDAGAPQSAGRAHRAMAVARALRSARADVLVSLLNPLVGAAASTIARRPFLHWLQNPFDESRRPIRRLPEGAQRLLLRALIGRTDAFMASSPGLVDDWAGFGVPLPRWVTVPNAVALAGIEAAPRSVVPADRPVRLLAVGRLAAQKRYDVLFDALAGLPARLSWQLDVLGDGPLRSELEQRVVAAGMTDRVSIHGFVPDPGPWFSRADVFVMSSDFEGFGNVVVQALAAGLPVVATDAPHGPRFILQSGALGTLVPPADPAALGHAITDAIGGARTEPASISARRRRAQQFEPAIVAEHVARVAEAARAEAPLPRGPW